MFNGIYHSKLQSSDSLSDDLAGLVGMAAVASQNPSEVFMLRPASFMFNKETAVTNHFQNKVLSVQCIPIHL